MLKSCARTKSPHDFEKNYGKCNKINAVRPHDFTTQNTPERCVNSFTSSCVRIFPYGTHDRTKPKEERLRMNEVIPLSEQIKATHPNTGRPVTVVGIDVSSAFGPKLVVLHRGPNGIYAELVDHADEVVPTSRA